MGSEGETNTQKPRYNISMSRRTRKPHNHQKEAHEKRDNDELTRRERDSEGQKSLKQLIEGRGSLAQLFREEEKEQSVVLRASEDGLGGVRLKRSTVRNFAKILSHLIKVKQESYIRSWRKPALSLKLIEHK